MSQQTMTNTSPIEGVQRQGQAVMAALVALTHEIASVTGATRAQRAGDATQQQVRALREEIGTLTQRRSELAARLKPLRQKYGLQA